MKTHRWLIALLALGCSVLVGSLGQAQIPPAPIPDFTASPISGVAPLQVSFTDLSTNGPTDWLWVFGDGHNSTFQNPSNLYANPGVYTVTLTARNTGGANTITKANLITVLATPPPPPVTAFTASPATGPAPLTVQFTDQTANFPTSWQWSFGDGATSTVQNPSHRYAAAGTFTVTLTTANMTGSNTLTKKSFITVTGATPPVADFIAAPTAGSPPLRVTFTDRSKNTPTAWLWGFGDGSPVVTEQNPVHVYTRLGRYSVTLTVTNSGGSSTKTEPDLIVVTFPDVPAGFWALPAILAIVNAGIASGFPNGLYQPALEVTRDQAAVFLARAIAGGDANVPPGPARSSFPDVPTSYWAYKYIEFIHARGIIVGFPDGAYRPTETVNRADVATFVARVLAGGDANVPEAAGTPFFPDVAVGSAAFKYIEFAKAQGIVLGFPDGLFHPEFIATRDQMAVFIVRTFKLPT